MNQCETWRIDVRNTVSETTPAGLVSGIPPWARALYLGSTLTTGSVDFLARSGPGGLPYDRRFTLGAGQYVAIDVSALDGLSVVATRATGTCLLIARATDTPPDWRWTRLASWYEAGGAATPTKVPPGAVGVVGVAAAPTWQWVARDRSGTAVNIPSPLLAGVEAPVLADEFDPGAAAVAIQWRIRL